MPTLINSDPRLTSGLQILLHLTMGDVSIQRSLDKNSRSLDKNSNNLQHHNITFYLLKYFKLHQIYSHIYLLVDLHNEIISSEVSYITYIENCNLHKSNARILFTI